MEPIITVLMNKIISCNVIPEQWKVAKVIPTYKKGNRQDANNYRPISNLCSVTKIFERLVLNRIGKIEEIEAVDLTGESQHGFKKNRSTETAGIEIQSKIATWCDNDEYVTVTSLDLTAAFDVVDHKLLVKRLKQIGLPNIITKTSAEWLREREFYCDIGGKASIMRRITHGTVQGSILGPVLFAIFISSIKNTTKHISTFADDNFALNHHKNKQEVLRRTKVSVEAVQQWLVQNGMKVNEEKTEICMFNKKDQEECQVNIGNSLITVKSQIKILGIIFDSKLNWFIHSQHAIGKANKAKQGLRLIRKYFTPSEMLKLSTAYFYSALYYGAKVWMMSSLNNTIKKRLWSISSQMLRVVDGNRNLAESYKALHKKYARATPAMWGEYVTANAMWELCNRQLPEYPFLKALLNRLNEERRRGFLFTRSNKCKIGFNCISNRMQVVSGKLIMNWQDMEKNAFKRLCKQELIEKELERL